MFFGVFIRTLISLVVMFLITKCIGSRQVSEMSMFDYVIGITVGSVAAELAISEEDIWKPVWAMVIYGASAVIISWLADKSIVLRRVIEGTPIVLYQDGTFLYENMKKSKIDLFEFLMMCRGQGYFDLSQVQCVILESNGKASVLPKSESRPATPADFNLVPEKANLFANLIMEGNIMYENLKNIGRDERWLKKQMQIHNIKKETDVFLAVGDGSETCYFFLGEKNRNDKDKLI